MPAGIMIMANWDWAIRMGVQTFAKLATPPGTIRQVVAGHHRGSENSAVTQSHFVVGPTKKSQ